MMNHAGFGDPFNLLPRLTFVVLCDMLLLDGLPLNVARTFMSSHDEFSSQICFWSKFAYLYLSTSLVFGIFS